MKINHDLRHRVTVVEAQGKALIEQKVELEADLQTKEQEMGSLRAELGKLRERLQGKQSQDGEEEAEVSRERVLQWCGDQHRAVVTILEFSYRGGFVLIPAVGLWGCIDCIELLTSLRINFEKLFIYKKLLFKYKVTRLRTQHFGS